MRWEKSGRPGGLRQSLKVLDVCNSFVTCPPTPVRAAPVSFIPLPGVLEDGLSSTGVPRSTAPGGISNPDKKMSCGTQCPNPQSLSSGPLTQKQNGLRTTEVTWTSPTSRGQGSTHCPQWRDSKGLRAITLPTTQNVHSEKRPHRS
ncbi:brain and acute leukemia cytoplasmic protein isoform X8 [Mirounga angustirostris]|uniref:brain and acute leukemia cytoplasmic protein isoform X8 n=1 Tax=Mirounga angustirostris TaxID=9716 RepID=UPI00313C8F16